MCLHYMMDIETHTVDRLALLGHALLVDLLALDPVREASQLRRPLTQRADDSLADRQVVPDEVALRVTRCREEHLVGFVTLTRRSPTSISMNGEAIA